MSSRPHIMMIDDDRHQAEFIATKLRTQGFRVSNVASENDVLSLAVSVRKRVSLYLVDVMMPTENWPRYTPEATLGGMITGFLVAADIRKVHSRKPIILWSTAPFESIAAYARDVTSAIPHCSFMYKSEAVDKVKRTYERFRTTGKMERGLLSQIWDRLIMQPNVYGVGLDVGGFIEQGGTRPRTRTR